MENPDQTFLANLISKLFDYICLKQRTKEEIIAKILECSNGEISYSKLLLKANLGSGQFKEYSDMLINSGLLKRLKDKNNRFIFFKTTDTGLLYLAKYESLMNLQDIEFQ